MRELVVPLFTFYGYPKHVKTDEQKKEFASVYIFELTKYRVDNLDAVKSHLFRNHKFLPKIEQIVEAIRSCTPIDTSNKRYVEQHSKYLDFYKRRKEMRVDFYQANSERVEAVIASGWGMDLACELSYCSENADRHDKMHLLCNDASARAHYSSPRTKGQDPLYYFENMPVNNLSLVSNLFHPVEFISGVMS